MIKFDFRLGNFPSEKLNDFLPRSNYIRATYVFGIQTRHFVAANACLRHRAYTTWLDNYVKKLITGEWTVAYAERPFMKGIIFLMMNIYPRISLISTFFRDNAIPQKFRQEK